jgi:hypothetical protein
MTDFAVSPNNPCPMLRALVVAGYAPDKGESISALVDSLGKARGGDAETNKKFRKTAKAVALAANGLWPWDLIHNALSGVRLDKLRDGPLDKHGAGSGILNAQGQIVEAELARLAQFASAKTDSAGVQEPGLDAAQITAMMDANFTRSPKHKKIHRKLMEGEWPVLLEIMGKSGANGLYLSLAEVRTLFVDRHLPDRVVQRLNAA